jgi:hypothetical protein
MSRTILRARASRSASSSARHWRLSLGSWSPRRDARPAASGALDPLDDLAIQHWIPFGAPRKGFLAGRRLRTLDHWDQLILPILGLNPKGLG